MSSTISSQCAIRRAVGEIANTTVMQFVGERIARWINPVKVFLVQSEHAELETR